MKVRIIAVILISVLSMPVLQAQGADGIPADIKATFEKVGVDVYPGAVYCTGQLDMGVRLATSDSPEKVRAWYRAKLSDWSLFEKFGMWSLVDSPGVNSMADVMKNNNLMVSENPEIPGWHQLAANMTTEILVALPRIPADSQGGALLTIPPGAMPPHSETVQEVIPMEVTGNMGSGEDMEFGLGEYFYIQDEEYREYPVVYTKGMPRDLKNRLYSISTTYDKLRIKGNLVVLEDGRGLGFDRKTAIEIFEAE